MKLSKDAITKKGQDYLKASKKGVCLVAEDGSIFLPEAERYAQAHGRKLQGNGEGYSGTIKEVKAGKTEKAEVAPEPEAPKAEKPKAKKKAKK